MAGMPSAPGPGMHKCLLKVHFEIGIIFEGAYRLPSEFGYYESKTVAK